MNPKNLRLDLETRLQKLLLELKNNDLSASQMRFMLEDVLVDAMLLEFIQNRDAALNRIAEKAGSKISAASTSLSPSTNTPSADVVKGHSAEVKQLPHPEGPPVYKATSVQVQPPAQAVDAEEALIYLQETEEKAEVAFQKNPQPEMASGPQPHHNAGASFIKTSETNSVGSSWELGLNDRIALTRHLFANNATDYNRVISQLSTLNSLSEAQAFINHQVKPDYDWSAEEEYVERFMELIEARFRKPGKA